MGVAPRVLSARELSFSAALADNDKLTFVGVQMC
jgi:hypothetical protein